MGGSFMVSSASPSREWFTVRVAAGPEGLRMALESTPNPVAVMRRAPPPRLA